MAFRPCDRFCLDVHDALLGGDDLDLRFYRGERRFVIADIIPFKFRLTADVFKALLGGIARAVFFTRSAPAATLAAPPPPPRTIV